MLKSTGSVVVMTEDEVARMIEIAARRGAEETARRIMPAVGKIRPPHVTQTDAAEMVGVSRRTISSMISHGTFRLNEFGMIPIDQIDRALEAKAA